MIIHLDSNYRNRSVYPDPSGYVLEINGTPPASDTSDSRSFASTPFRVLYSSPFFERSVPVAFRAYARSFVILDLGACPDARLRGLLEQPRVALQSYFVGYEARCLETGLGSVVSSCFFNYNQFVCVLASPIAESGGTLVFVNPSLRSGDNFLIAGYSFLNQQPGEGFYHDNGVSTNTTLVNLTRKSTARVVDVLSPFKNVLFDGDGSFRPREKDIVLLVNGRLSTGQNHFFLTIRDIYPSALYTYEVVGEMPEGLVEGDRLESVFGEPDEPETDPVFPRGGGGFYRLYPGSGGDRKIVFRVDAARRLAVEFPGNGIEAGKLYPLRCVRDPAIAVSIRCTRARYAFLTADPIPKTTRLMVYLLTGIFAVPVYSVVIGTAGSVLYLDSPPFEGDVLLYENCGAVPYSYVYPSLVMPVANNPLVCCQVQLSSLSLPNLPICGTNLLLTDYPYVLVAFGTATGTDARGAGTLSLGNMYSNNPNALVAVFVASLANIRNPDLVRYAVVRSPQIVSMKLNLAESLRFAVFLPDGSPLSYARSYERNLITGEIVNTSFGCSSDESLTTEPTRVYWSEDTHSVSATFVLRALA
jgi:hypothetical protein